MNTSTPWHRLEVRHRDGLRFQVQSEAGGSPHHVDASAEGGLGTCDCKDFQCRVEPVRAGRKPAPNTPGWISACKHLMRIWLFLGRQVACEAAKQDQNDNYKGP